MVTTTVRTTIEYNHTSGEFFAPQVFRKMAVVVDLSTGYDRSDTKYDKDRKRRANLCSFES